MICYYSVIVTWLLLHTRVTCHDFGYGRAAWVPGPHPFHIHGKVKKKQTRIKIYPFIYFLCRLRSIATHRDHYVRRLSVRLSHFSVTLSKAMFRRRHMHSLECCHYFWVKKIPHSYTFDVKMIPIHILGALKKPFQPHICIYLDNGS